MNKYTVIVRTLLRQFAYITEGTDSVTVHQDAIDRFGVCGVTVVAGVR